MAAVHAEAWPKGVRSALCIIPPVACWPQIQAIRKAHDRVVQRWMPHINVLYPFVHAVHFGDAAVAVREALTGVEPFTVRLERFHHFEHGRRSTVWLQPEVAGAGVHDIHDRLLTAFPQCDDLKLRGEGGYAPHLSVGQWGSREVHKGKDRLQGAFLPVEFILDRVFLISREADQPFCVQCAVKLGEASDAIVRHGEPRGLYHCDTDPEAYEAWHA